MIRGKAISIMVKKSIKSCVYCNMQSHGLVTPKKLDGVCFTLSSAMGLGGGQTLVIVRIYD